MNYKGLVWAFNETDRLIMAIEDCEYDCDGEVYEALMNISAALKRACEEREELKRREFEAMSERYLANKRVAALEDVIERVTEYTADREDMCEQFAEQSEELDDERRNTATARYYGKAFAYRRVNRKIRKWMRQAQEV